MHTCKCEISCEAFFLLWILSKNLKNTDLSHQMVKILDMVCKILSVHETGKTRCKVIFKKINLNKNTKIIHLQFTCVNIPELYSAKYNIASQTPALQAADWASP